MAFVRYGYTAALEQLLGYGTSEGVKKSWEHRRRAQPRSITQALITPRGELNADALSKIGGQAGSNPGGLYQAPDGAQFYVKQAKTEDHARNEVLAAKLYEAAGVRVPQVGLAIINGQQGVASKIVTGLKVKNSPEALIAAGAQEDFAADAWLQNWDVVGLEYDNMAINVNSGKVLRLDTGGALRYRAQGGTKPEMPTVVYEFDSMTNPTRNAITTSVFSNMPKDTMMRSMKKVAMVPTNTIRHLVLKFGPQDPSENQKLMDTLISRRDDITQAYKHKYGGIL